MSFQPAVVDALAVPLGDYILYSPPPPAGGAILSLILKVLQGKAWKLLFCIYLSPYLNAILKHRQPLPFPAETTQTKGPWDQSGQRVWSQPLGLPLLGALQKQLSFPLFEDPRDPVPGAVWFCELPCTACWVFSGESGCLRG